MLLAFDFTYFYPVSSGAPFSLQIYFDKDHNKILDVGEQVVEINWTNPNCLALDGYIANLSRDVAFDIENNVAVGYSKSTCTLEITMTINKTHADGDLFLGAGELIPFWILLWVGDLKTIPYFFPSNNSELAAFNVLPINTTESGSQSGLTFFNDIAGPVVGIVVGMVIGTMGIILARMSHRTIN